MRALIFAIFMLIGFAALADSPSAALPAAPSSAPLPPGEAAKHMTLPVGFSATLFAGEPDVVQPIATAIDDRGRLWVAECLSYPKWQTDPKAGHDRIVIFEDANGDGHFSKRTVFADNLSNLSGLEIGFGGVWVCSSPNLLFIPLDASGDKPGAEPKVMLDGWDIKTAQHNVFNRLTWGPDGWLYGCNGIQSKSNVGKPGATDAQRTPINCGVWRYHPVRGTFELVAQGTTNPWGLDFDDYGEMFITNCVIEHLFHIVPGGHYKRMYGEDFNPHAYGLMQTCADHIHWGGGPWTASRGGVGAHGTAGGGHAHAGCMVYLGDNWPDEYRNNVFMCNIHGNRVNRDILEQKGSGYVAHHGQDFLLANDSWFRGLNMVYGPDGGVYVQDWCDTGECHNYKVVDSTNGRIFKVVYGKIAPVKVDVASLSDEELVKLQLHKNDWYVRHARRVLQERAAAGKLAEKTVPALKESLRNNPDVTRKLRALWALYSVGAMNDQLFMELSGSNEPQVRKWGVRLGVDQLPVNAASANWLAILAMDPSPMVRLAVASAVQRVQPDDCRTIIAFLVSRQTDASDPNLPLMLWYAIEPSLRQSAMAPEIVNTAKLPLIRGYAARMAIAEDLTWLPRLLTSAQDAPSQIDVLRGAQVALKDRRVTEPPPGWFEVEARLALSENIEVRRRSTLLSLSFGEANAKAAVRKFVSDPQWDAIERLAALQALVQIKPPDIAPLLHSLLTDRAMAGAALRALASCGDDSTPPAILANYPRLSLDDKRDAIGTLASRAAYAKAMLEAVSTGTLPRADLNALTVRQLGELNDPIVDAQIKKMWGSARKIEQDKAQLMATYKAELTPEALKSANLSNGRRVFANTCAACHTMFDAGGKVGPNLTGSQRANLDYVLENVLDPSAVVANEYLMTLVRTTDGRVITGIIEEDGPTSLTLKMPGESVTVLKSEIKSRKTESISMMPEGLIQGLSTDDRRDLIAYLASPGQVPLPTDRH